MRRLEPYYSLGKSLLAGVIVALALLALMAEHAKRHDTARNASTMLNAEAFYAQF